MKIFPEICFSVIIKMREGMKKGYTLPLAAQKLVEQFNDLIKNKSYHNEKASAKFNKEIEELMVPELIRIRDFK